MNSDHSAVVTFFSPTAAQAVMDRTGQELEVEGQRIELSWAGEKESQEKGGPGVEPVVRAGGPVQVVNVGPGWGVPQYFSPVQVTTVHPPLVHHYPPHTYLPCYYYLPSPSPFLSPPPVQGHLSQGTEGHQQGPLQPDQGHGRD